MNRLSVKDQAKILLLAGIAGYPVNNLLQERGNYIYGIGLGSGNNALFCIPELERII
jgi:hypothetical protein